MNRALTYWSVLVQAAWGLRDNARRSVLSLLGVALGVAAVIMVDALARGAHAFVNAELETFGLRTVWISRDPRNPNPERAIRQGSGIENADFFAVRAGCCPSVALVSPLISTRGRNELAKSLAALPIRNGNQFSNARLEGVAEAHLAITGDTLAAGRYLSAREVAAGHQVAVLGVIAARDLFGAEQAAVGRAFRIGEERFIVVGVLGEKNRNTLVSLGIRDDNNRISVPYTAYQRLVGSAEIASLQIQAVSPARAHLAAQEVIAVLERRHTGRYRYGAEVMADHQLTADRILDAVTLVGVVSALVSLFVGGLGIMNIMSTAVIERTREIGLRKAVGARRRDILLQFLLEAVLISGAGGVLGVALGVVGSHGLARATAFPPSVSSLAVLIAFVCSIAVGVLSGLLPAQRASALEPVRALRFE